MRKLIRIVAGAALLTAFALVSTPASANHHGTGDGWPDGGGHENEPKPLQVTAPPHSTCAVTGQVTTDADGNPADGDEETTGGPQHLPVPDPPGDPVTGNPSHSHYNFLDTAIACVGTVTQVFDVEADGGNDGHRSPDNPQAAHPFNNHHGSVNFSAWSNSALYSGDKGTLVAPHPCRPTAVTNKGDISATPTVPPQPANLGWVKYVRVGALVHAWGCFQAGPNAGTTFSADLDFTPTNVPTLFLLNGSAVLGNDFTALPPV